MIFQIQDMAFRQSCTNALQAKILKMIFKIAFLLKSLILT